MSVTGHLVVTRGMVELERTRNIRSWVAEKPESRCRIDQGDVLMMLCGERYTDRRGGGRHVMITQRATVTSLLAAGIDVASNDTWPDTLPMRELADCVGAAVETWDMRSGIFTARIEDRSDLVPAGPDRRVSSGDRVGTLVVTRGLPGCGKTTRARSWVADDPGRRCRYNRDDVRLMFHGLRYTGIRACERAVTIAQHAAIPALLAAGFDVVSDDTWLHDANFAKIRDSAAGVGAGVEIWDMRDVAPEVCIERDAGRGSLVGPDVINDLHRRFLTP